MCLQVHSLVSYQKEGKAELMIPVYGWCVALNYTTSSDFQVEVIARRAAK